MATTIETVYLGHDNSIDLILKSDEVAVNLASVSKITITVGEVTIESDNGDSDPITWAKAGYATGEVRLFLGDQTLVEAAQPYTCYLVIYDVDHPDGIVWGYVLIRVKAEVERP